jgi:glutamate 5-kinase
VTDEIRFGDNDTLGSLVANLIEADVLVILTDQQGLYSADPRQDKNAKFIQHAIAGDVSLERMAGGAGTNVGTGGMLTKILAAKRASRSGAHTVIASGREKNVLVRLAVGEVIGTHLQTTEMKTTARKQWLADHLQLRGKLTLDAGAVKVIKQEGKSLLPIGVIAIEGTFERGEVVACCDANGDEIARGLVNYSSTEALRIMRKPSAEIEKILGYVEESELIHRDNLVLL